MKVSEVGTSNSHPVGHQAPLPRQMGVREFPSLSSRVARQQLVGTQPFLKTRVAIQTVVRVGHQPFSQQLTNLHFLVWVLDSQFYDCDYTNICVKKRLLLWGWQINTSIFISILRTPPSKKKIQLDSKIPLN
jgi:hypothetical protein